jgi:hypothetical protein
LSEESELLESDALDDDSFVDSFVDSTATSTGALVALSTFAARRERDDVEVEVGAAVTGADSTGADVALSSAGAERRALALVFSADVDVGAVTVGAETVGAETVGALADVDSRDVSRRSARRGFSVSTSPTSSEPPSETRTGVSVGSLPGTRLRLASFIRSLSPPVLATGRSSTLTFGGISPTRSCEPVLTVGRSDVVRGGRSAMRSLFVPPSTVGRSITGSMVSFATGVVRRERTGVFRAVDPDDPIEPDLSVRRGVLCVTSPSSSQSSVDEGFRFTG